MYPALLALVSFGMMALLLVYIVPDIVKVFVSRGADPPFLTKALDRSKLVPPEFRAVPAARPRRRRAGLSLGAGAGQSAAHRSLLLGAASVPPLQPPAQRRPLRRQPGHAGRQRRSPGRRAACRGGGHAQSLVRERALGVAARVREGISLRSGDERGGVFPSMLVAIVASGRSSGRPALALDRASHELQRELDAIVGTLVALVEPLVLLVMGGLVLMMVLAILLPIINLNNPVGLDPGSFPRLPGRFEIPSAPWMFAPPRAGPVNGSIAAPSGVTAIAEREHT